AGRRALLLGQGLQVDIDTGGIPHRLLPSSPVESSALAKVFHRSARFGEAHFAFHARVGQIDGPLPWLPGFGRVRAIQDDTRIEPALGSLDAVGQDDAIPSLRGKPVLEAGGLKGRVRPSEGEEANEIPLQKLAELSAASGGCLAPATLGPDFLGHALLE